MTHSSDLLTRALLSLKAEMAITQNCLQQAATSAAHDRLGEARELLANAKRAHQSVLDEISKLPPKYDSRSHAAWARILEGEIDVRVLHQSNSSGLPFTHGAF